MPADLNREVQLADLLEQARSRFAPARPVSSVDLNTPPPLRDELDGLLAVVRLIDLATADWRDAASAVETIAISRSQNQATLAAPVPPPAAERTALTRVGRYQIVRQLGAGGMGEVYEAIDPQLNRRVALKLPFLGPGRDSLRQRFIREARAAAGVRHPNVCPVYDAGEDGGRPFVVMAYVEGGTLADRLGQGRIEDVREAVALAAQVAEGLAAVHAAGIVHRDLKPGNILIEKSGNPLLTDFGLARPVDAGEHLTAEGAALGTPAFMSPEQADPALGPTTHQTDLYSLGVTMFQMLTGRLPFTGSVAQQLVRLASGPIVPPPSSLRQGLDRRLDAIVQKATARGVTDRYGSASQLAADLKGWLAAPVPAPAQRTVVPPPLPQLQAEPLPLPLPIEQRPARRWLVPAAVAAVLFVGVGIWAAGGLNGQKGEDKAGGQNPKKGTSTVGEGMNLAAVVEAPEKIPGLEEWNIELDGRADAPFGVRFLGGNRLRFQFNFSGAQLERVADLTTGTRPSPRGPGVVLAISPDRTTCVLWDGPEKGAGYYGINEETPRRRLRELKASQCSISPDGKTLAALVSMQVNGQVGQPLSTWNLATGGRVWEEVVGMANQPARGTSGPPVWVDGGRAIAAIGFAKESGEASVFLRAAADGKLVDTLPTKIAWAEDSVAGACAASPDASLLAVTGGNADGRHTLAVWQVKPKKELLTFEAGPTVVKSNAHVSHLNYASFSADGKRVSFAAGDGNVRVWDLESGDLLRTVETRATAADSPFTADLSADGKILAIRQQRAVRFVNVENGTLRGTLLFMAGGHEWVALSPNGHYKASSAEAEKKLMFVARETGKEETREFTPAEFAAKYGWRNDPTKVKLLGE